MQLHALAVQFLLDDELVVLVPSLFDAFGDLALRATSTHHGDDILESSFQPIAEHGTEAAERDNRRVLHDGEKVRRLVSAISLIESQTR